SGRSSQDRSTFLAKSQVRQAAFGILCSRAWPTFPFVRAPGDRPRPGTRKDRTMSEQRKDTILYVDDDEANRRTFTWIFQAAGFNVREAATGNEALRLSREKPDLVVLDVNLPDINGFEVCRRIKMHPGTSSIPVLHLSACY